MIRTLLLIVAVVCASHAAEQCPWLNAATAAGILEGGIQAQQVTPGKGSDADCRFTSQTKFPRELTVHVETTSGVRRDDSAYGQPCRDAATPLKAIGNDARVCAIGPESGRVAEQIVGRVRDRIFVIVVTTGDPAVSRPALQAKARLAAEQVAGILF